MTRWDDYGTLESDAGVSGTGAEKPKEPEMLQVPTSEAVESAGRDPDIVASWRRSEIFGVDPGLPVDRLDTEELVEADERLLHALGPVLDQLADVLRDTDVSVAVGDHRSVLVASRTPDRETTKQFERMGIVPGRPFSEDLVGTNAVGTAAEVRRFVRIAGPEHYLEAFKALSCYGAPIVHPLTGRLLGVIDFTFPAASEHPIMRSLMIEVLDRIHKSLLDMATASERAQVECFLTLGRRSRRPVLSLLGDSVLLNGRARQLDWIDQSTLQHAASQLGARHGETFEIDLSDGQRALGYVHREFNRISFPGVVLELDATRRTQRRRSKDIVLPGLVGVSPSWKAFCVELDRSVRTGLPLLVFGAPGTGKLAAVRALHEQSGSGDLVVADVATADTDGRQSWLRELREALAQPATVVLRHIEEAGTLAAGIAGELDRPGARARLLGTYVGEPSGPVADRFRHHVRLPALHDRREDIVVLAQRFLAPHGSSAVIRFGPDALAALRAADLCGNVRELERLVTEAAIRRRYGEVRASDLVVSRSPAANLTAFERAEREAIVASLREADGNKSEAARILGVGRSTLYRKLVALGIDVNDS